MNRSWIASIALVSLLAAGCGKDKDGSGSGGGGGSSEPPKPKTAEECFTAAKKAMESGDIDTLWGFFSKKSREFMIQRAQKDIDQMNKGGNDWEEMSKEVGRPVEELKKLSAEDFAKLERKHRLLSPEDMEREKKTKVDSYEKRDKVTVVHFTEEDGRKRLLGMIEEDGSWKIDMDETQKLKDEERKLNESK